MPSGQNTNSTNILAYYKYKPYDVYASGAQKIYKSAILQTVSLSKWFQNKKSPRLPRLLDAHQAALEQYLVLDPPW